MKYHLITTDAKINSKNKIFLGEWCKEIKNNIDCNKFFKQDNHRT